MREWFKKHILIVISLMLGIILAGFLLSECEKTQDLERDLESMDNFHEIEKQQLVDRDSIRAQDVRQMKQNLMSEIAARILLEQEFERFKEINSHVRFETITRIDSLRITYIDTIYNILTDYTDFIPIDTVSKYFLQTPKGLKFDDGWFNFVGTVDMDGLTIDSMSFINKFDVTIGYKKSDKPFAFLRKKVPVVELISYNPYTTVNYVNNVIVVDKKGGIFTSKPAFFIYGGVLGYGVAKLKQ